MIPDTLAALTIPLASVARYPGNPRTHNLDVLRSSLRHHGQYRPIVVNRRTMQVLAGNGTHEAAEREGWSEIAATFVDADEEQAARIVAVDNRASDLGGYDDGALLAILESLPSLEGTGYTDADTARLIAALSEAAPVDPYDEWQGMPEFESGNLRGVFYVIVHFASDADAEEFFKLLGRPKQKTMWWPEHDGHHGGTTKIAYAAVDPEPAPEPADAARP